MKNLLSAIDELAERFLPQNKVAEGGTGSGRHAGEMSAKAERASQSAGRTHGGQMKASDAHHAAGKAHEKAAADIREKAPTPEHMKAAMQHDAKATAHFARSESHLMVAGNMSDAAHSK